MGFFGSIAHTISSPIRHIAAPIQHFIAPAVRHIPGLHGISRGLRHAIPFHPRIPYRNKINKIVHIPIKIVSGIGHTAQGAGHKVQDIAKNIYHAPGNALKGAGNALKSVKDEIKGDVSAGANFFKGTLDGLLSSPLLWVAAGVAVFVVLKK